MGVPDAPSVQSEDPIMLLIISKEGLVLFSRRFEEDEHLNDQILAGMLTTISNFGKEIFTDSGALDRIRYQNYTIAMKPLEPLLVCYIFLGQSYLALQKLDHFIARIRATSALIQPLTTIIQRDQASKALPTLTPTVILHLRELTTEIFSSPQTRSDSGGVIDAI